MSSQSIIMVRKGIGHDSCVHHWVEDHDSHLGGYVTMRCVRCKSVSRFPLYITNSNPGYVNLGGSGKKFDKRK